MRRTLLAMGGVFAGLAAIVGISLWILVRVKSEPLPTGTSGRPAEELSERIASRVGLGAFSRTGAIAFTFRGANRHFMDLRRRFSEVRWHESGAELTVQFHHDTGRHVALRNENPLAEEPARAVFREGLKRHTNDFFWFNPLAALYAPGAGRLFVGERALLITFTTGGLTPGDSYLFVTDRTFRPESIRMWASVLPIRGMRFTFEEWKKMPTGFEVSLKRRSDLAEVNLSEVRALPAYPEAGQPDRFSALAAIIARSRASGQP